MTHPSTGSPINLEDIPTLIESAFAAARAKGKVEWRSMTTAVLKNRLLQLTNRAFDHRALGFSSFDALLTQFPALVQLDHTTQPTTVEFIAEARDPSFKSHGPTRWSRIRRDLWNGMLDYSAGHEWVWDLNSREARPIQDGDHEPLIVPTVQPDELADLRARFATEYEESLNEPEKGRLDLWQTLGLGTAALPQALQGRWNEYLKSEVIRRLTMWFEVQDIDPPDDLIGLSVNPVTQGTDQELGQLRTLVIECVRSMTLSELAALALPAGVVLRSQGHRASRRHAG